MKYDIVHFTCEKCKLEQDRNVECKPPRTPWQQQSPALGQDDLADVICRNCGWTQLVKRNLKQ